MTDSVEILKIPDEQLRQPSYSVDALMEKLSITANIKVWKTIDSLVHVQGSVGRINTYRNVVYFELKGSGTTLTVKCPSELSPVEGENIIVEGMPLLKPSRFQTGLEVQIDGKPVANWEPRTQRDSSENINLEKNSFIRLYNFFSQNGFEGFTIFGTETTIRDVISHIPENLRNEINTRKIRVSDKKDMLSDLRSSFINCTGFAIVRGGDDASLDIWNDREVVKELLQYGVPFYIALGHTHCVTLTTQYADESFHTPSAFGNALSSVVEQFTYQQLLSSEVEDLKKKELTLEKSRSALLEKEKYFKEFISSANRAKNDLKLAVFIQLIIILALGYFLFR